LDFLKRRPRVKDLGASFVLKGDIRKTHEQIGKEESEGKGASKGVVNGRWLWVVRDLSRIFFRAITLKQKKVGVFTHQHLSLGIVIS
jgi:hypothetical protein